MSDKGQDMQITMIEPAGIAHCPFTRQDCSTPWECCSGTSCRIVPPKPATSDSSASGNLIWSAAWSNFVWWLKTGVLIVLIALALGMIFKGAT
jgi:hypothetical protein